MSDIKTNKNGYSMIPDTLLAEYDYKHMAILSKIAALAYVSGFCSAGNDKLIKEVKSLNKDKIGRELDWLDKHGLTVRYNRFNKINGEFATTKRLIVLSDYAYQAYKALSLNRTIHKPIECPKGFLEHEEYLKVMDNAKKDTKSIPKAKKASRDANVNDNSNNQTQKPESKDNQNKDHLEKPVSIFNDNPLDTIKHQEKPKKELFKHSKSTFSNEKRTELYIRFCNYYQKRGYDDYIQRATAKLEQKEKQAAARNK